MGRAAKPLTTTIELYRLEVLAAARWSLHLAADHLKALGDQLEICEPDQLGEELARVRTLLERAEHVFVHAVPLDDNGDDDG